MGILTPDEMSGYEIHVIEFDNYRIEIHTDGVHGSISSNLCSDNPDVDTDFDAAMRGIESLLLALACEEIDVSTDRFKNAVESAVYACVNNL